MNKSIGVNIAKLLSSKVAARVISMMTAPIVARLFLPEHFGVCQIFMSIAAVITVVACLRYEASIPLGRDENEAVASFTLSIFLSLAFTLIVLVVIPVGKEKIALWFKAPELNILLWLLPIAVFMRGFQSSLEYWAARGGSFGAIAWSGFGSVFGGRSITIAWALIIGASAAGVLAGYFSSAAVGILLLLIFLSRKLVSDIKNANLNLGVLWTVAKRHRKFPLVDIWSGLLNTFSTQLPSMLLGLYFSTTVVGYYSLGDRIVSLPMLLLGGSIDQVFFPTAAEEYNATGTLSKIVSNVFRRLVQISVFPMVALAFLGATLFGFVFGQKWLEAGVYAQILSGWILLRFITSPLSTVFFVLHRQGTILAFNVGLAFSRTVALLLGAKMGIPRVALAAYSVVSAIGFAFLLCWILRNSGVSLRWGANVLLKYILSSCLLLLPAGLLAWISGKIFIVLASLGLATIIYAWGLYRFDPSLRNIITERLPFGRWNRKEISL